jgi:hypothetical protein
MSVEPTTEVPDESSGDQRLAILLAMAMFVLVVDTSLMNVSISAVVHDLDENGHCYADGDSGSDPDGHRCGAACRHDHGRRDDHLGR